MRVYLSGSITLVEPGTDARTWADPTEAELQAAGLEVFNVYKHEFGLDMNPAEVVAHDIREIRKSDIVLCNASLPSWGAAQEIYIAHQMGLYVISFCPASTRRSPWMRRHSHCVVPTRELAVAEAIRYARQGASF